MCSEPVGCTPEGAGCLAGLSFYIADVSSFFLRPADLKLIIEAAGGAVLDQPPEGTEGGRAVIIVSTPEKKNAWSPLLATQKQLIEVRPEGVLSAVIRQRWDAKLVA